MAFDKIDYIAFYDKPFLKFERLLQTYLAFAPKGFESFRTALPQWMSEKLFQKRQIIDGLRELMGPLPWQEKLLFSEHHLSHAASAFFPSPYQEAIVLTMDGVGEWTTTSVAMGRGSSLEIQKELHFPHSLGLLYSAFTYYTGFKVNSGEYKLMGLAPYGKPTYVNKIYDRLLQVKPDGTFRLNMEYFDFCTGLTMTNEKFHTLFGLAPRKATAPLTQEHMDLAASVQVVLEEIILKIVRTLASETRIPNLCLAGGVALNCVANGKILRDESFKNIWIQPAAGDAGGALGAALSAYYLHLNSPRTINKTDSMKGSFLGPLFSQTEIELRLKAAGATFHVLSETELLDSCTKALTEEKALGWFQGRMEFGPRALGARSILADPRSPKMQTNLNLKVKYRESFRPFAPSILREDLSDWFEMDTDSPYMLFVANIEKRKRLDTSVADDSLFGIEKLNILRSQVPAVTHVDFSARIQTVHKETNPLYHALLSRFKEQTGCPILVNTSFNVRGEPLVCSPEDAFRCFMGTEIDALAIGNCFLRKEEQNPQLKLDYSQAFELD